MVTVAEEVQDVRRTLPAAVIISLLLTTVLYISVATVAVLAVPPADLAAADTPLARVVAKQGQLAVIAIVLVSLLAGVNSALVQLVMAARGELLIVADLPDAEAPSVEERVNQRHPELLVLGPDVGGSPPFP